VWAVGVICYQLLTLEFPFRVKEFLPQGRDPFDEGLKPASGINRSVNPLLDEIIAKALCVDPGHTVDEHARKNGPFQPVEALKIALQVASALSAAARMNLIHRDLKPANIMLEVDDEGKQVVKVIDFGLAKSLSVTEGESGTMGLTAGFVGTPQYASPEQVKNREMDIRSDIYSLGVTIYFMLTGRPPFRGELFDIFKQIVETPVPLEPLKDLPPSVVSLVKRLMAKDPNERPETPRDSEK
jgi:serine/threonine protein kinase